MTAAGHAAAARLPSRQVAAAGAAVALTAVAYAHSLSTTGRFLTGDTPLAYLGILPVVAVVVGSAKSRPRPGELRLPDRQVDWIVGLGLLGLAVALAVGLPRRLTYDFWTNRLDVLGIPFFVGGALALLCGTRVVWRVRSALLLLLLAWPLPYELILDRALGVASHLTLVVVRAAAPHLDGVRATGPALFDLGEGASRFTVNVAPQCAGANSALGFVLLGGAVSLLFPGSRGRKLLWLAGGTIVMLLVNAGRVVLLFVVGARFGERVAIEWLHPYIGLVLFTGVVAVLVGLLPRFGIPLRLPRLEPAAGHGTRRAGAAAVATVAICASVLAVANQGLRRYDPFLGLSDAGTHRPLTQLAASFGGWTHRRTQDVTWARQYFGTTSSWRRFTYVPLDTTAAVGPIWLDVVQVGDLRRFSEFGLEACYRFHGYRIAESGRRDIGAAAPAQTMAYVDDDAGRGWAVVSWVVPVTAGATVRYERAVLLTSTDVGGAPAAIEELTTVARSIVRSTDA